MAVDSTVKLRDANRSASEASRAFDRFDQLLDTNQSDAIRIVSDEMSILARRMIVANYNRSGVQSQSGKLRDALYDVTARFAFVRGSAKITISMPAGVGDYSKKDGGGNFYRAAASVNYGAVRDSKNTNKRERKAIKRKALKQAKKDGKLTEFDSYAARGVQESSSVSGSMGSVVIQPRGFWQLTGSQKDTLANAALELFMRTVFNFR